MVADFPIHRLLQKGKLCFLFLGTLPPLPLLCCQTSALRARPLRCTVASVTVFLQHSPEAPWQQLSRDWYGSPVSPPFEFRCRLTAEFFVFSARRSAPALLHPEARENHFQPNLWRFDVAEFFIAPSRGEPYFEFNLSPNGAWWAAAFTSPRVINPAFPEVPPGISACGQASPAGWFCEAHIPLSLLSQLGISPASSPCRLAVDAILNSPHPLFLTTAADPSGTPNFHRPWSWDFCFAAPRRTGLTHGNTRQPT